jgi:hypothetical protein
MLDSDAVLLLAGIRHLERQESLPDAAASLKLALDVAHYLAIHGRMPLDDLDAYSRRLFLVLAKFEVPFFADSLPH